MTANDINKSALAAQRIGLERVIAAQSIEIFELKQKIRFTAEILEDKQLQDVHARENAYYMLTDRSLDDNE